ncbi:lipopolysaccharide assembly protein LapB [Bacteroides sp. GM023]|uniref:tetratricopeptide repeat protein n=1 Tax=Bacteroides sp. GM023 TaxID=2723058 RepID=UPI00168BC311|nr:hypothetical protein [Bacteroides sp. GM023]MBD3591999.1 hypothetical protein [Bacteroides sp. GM023]
MKCRIILGILIVLSFTGCYNREQDSRLDEAEALLQNKPDSALTILQQFIPGSQQAEQARYALLYSAALDKNHIKITNDSLIRKAWNYYEHHPKNLRNQCKTLYYWGRIKLRADDKAGALRIFLEIEKKLKDTNEPYYKGLLYNQIGEVYYAQMNYNRAYHYFRESRNNFRQSENLREETEATLDMAASAYHSKDIEKAMRLYSAALDLADEQKNDELAESSLTNLASLYVISGKRQIPHDLLQRIELSARKDTLYGYHTLVDVQLLKNRVDSARHYLKLAEAHTTDIRDMADLYYTAYRIEAQSKNFEKATDNIHRYIYLTDSLTRSNMQFSAGMVEREYFQEQSAFAEYRIKNRTILEISAIVIVILLLGVAWYIIRQRMRLQRERTDHYLLLAEEANSEYKALTERMEGQRSTESHLKGLVTSRFDIIDKLGKTYYERENTLSQQAAMFQEVKQIITDFSENNEMLQELELIVNTCHDNAMQKLRNDFPAMKEADIRLLCYIFVGFSPQVISLFMKDTVANVYARKSRLKSRIKSAETTNKDLFLSLFE